VGRTDRTATRALCVRALSHVLPPLLAVLPVPHVLRSGDGATSGATERGRRMGKYFRISPALPTLTAVVLWQAVAVKALRSPVGLQRACAGTHAGVQDGARAHVGGDRGPEAELPRPREGCAGSQGAGTCPSNPRATRCRCAVRCARVIFFFFWGSERAAPDLCGVDCLPWVGRTSLHVSTRGALRSARARACRPSAGDARASERVVSPAVAGVVRLGSGWQWGLGTAAAHVAPASARVIARDGEAVSSQRNGQFRGLVSFDLSQWDSSTW
jgi:hypothetical protein